MKSRIVYHLAVAAGLGAMCAAGQTGPSARNSDPPATTLPPTGEDLRKRVAIDAFDYSAVIPMVQLIFNPGLEKEEKKKKAFVAPTVPNIGAGIQAMLIQRLSEAAKVVIVDKDKMEELKKTQDDGISVRNKQGKGARPGALRTPDLLLAGNVVVFGRDDKGFHISTGGLPCLYCGIANAISKEEDKAVVKVTYRLIDGETAEVLKSGEAEGHSIRKTKGFGGMAAANGKGGGIAVSMGSANFEQTIIGEATVDCVNNLAAALNEQLGKMKHRVHEVEGNVAEVSGNTVTLATGSNDGVNVGDVFEIDKFMGDVKDPLTGEVLYKKTEKKGEMTVTEVHEKVAIGTYVGTPAEPKDIARRKTAAGEQK